MPAGRTPSHVVDEAENPTTPAKSAGIVDGSHDVMVVEIPPVMAAVTTGNTVSHDSSTEIPATAVVGKQLTAGRVDSTEILPGTSAAMAVTGDQLMSEGGDSGSTSTRQSAATRL